MKVMVSYNRGEWDEVREILDLLTDFELPFWIDRIELGAGVDWREELLKTARTSDAFVPFLSRRYAYSPMCRMELLMARSFRRPIFPVMLEECWGDLEAHEETRFISDITVARYGAQNFYGLRTTQDDLVARLGNALTRCLNKQKNETPNVYISYPSTSAKFATHLYDVLSKASGVRPWVATKSCLVGQDWREAQIEALTTSTAHVTIASGGLIGDNPILRTEILLSESLKHPTFVVEDPELEYDRDLKSEVILKLEKDHAFRRLTERQWFEASEIETRLLEEIRRFVSIETS